MTATVTFRRYNAAVMLALGCLISACLRFVPPPDEEDWPSWAPDGQRLVYECYLDGPVDKDRGFISRLNHENADLTFYTPEAADLCISDSDGNDMVRLTRDKGGDWHPAWSPDGSRIAYLRADGIYLITPDGQHRRQLAPVEAALGKLSWSSRSTAVLTWSPGGEHLLFSGCLESRDHDVYVIDVGTGTMTNLTPDDRTEDFAPMWTSHGSKIVYLSTEFSSPYGCEPDEDALPQIRVMDADGTGDRVVYDPEFYYSPSQVSVSDSGQILFVSDMVSRTADEYYSSYTEYPSLYSIDLAQDEPEKVHSQPLEYVRDPVWSPDERCVAYLSGSELHILDMEKGTDVGPYRHLSIGQRYVWSPNGQKIAVVVSKYYNAFGPEEHIHILDVQSGTYHPLVQSWD